VAIQYLKNARVYLGNYDYSGDANEVGLTYEAKDLDCTSFNSGGAEEHMCGLLKFGLDLKGFVDYSAAITNDTTLYTNVGTAAMPVTVLTTSTEGDRGFFGNGMQANYNPGAKVGDLLAFSVKGSGSGALIRGNSLVIGSKTASGNGTAFALGAVTAAQSLYGILHVLAFSGLTSIAVKIQSAAASNFATPHDQITFTTATGITSQYATPVAGANTDTYWRAVWTVVGTGSALIAVTMGIQ
jgi:hypothetical protein